MIPYSTAVQTHSSMPALTRSRRRTCLESAISSAGSFCRRAAATEPWPAVSAFAVQPADVAGPVNEASVGLGSLFPAAARAELLSPIRRAASRVEPICAQLKELGCSFAPSSITETEGVHPQPARCRVEGKDSAGIRRELQVLPSAEDLADSARQGCRRRPSHGRAAHEGAWSAGCPPRQGQAHHDLRTRPPTGQRTWSNATSGRWLRTKLWVANFTYISTMAGWVYVAFVIDAGVRFTERLLETGIDASIGSVGDAHDNSLAESINGLFKTDLIKPRRPWRHAAHVEAETAATWIGSTTNGCTNTVATCRQRNSRAIYYRNLNANGVA